MCALHEYSQVRAVITHTHTGLRCGQGTEMEVVDTAQEILQRCLPMWVLSLPRGSQQTDHLEDRM